jgi:hypothetical protein
MDYCVHSELLHCSILEYIVSMTLNISSIDSEPGLLLYLQSDPLLLQLDLHFLNFYTAQFHLVQ